MNTITPQLRDAGLRAAGLLPHVGVLRCAGPDAVTFLQGQLSNDVRRLAKAQTLLTALSTPQGRVVAVMHLLPHSTGILAVMPREVVLPTLERLRKFVMRAKVQIEDVSEEFAVAGVHDTAETDPDYAEGELIGRGRLGGAALRAAPAARSAVGGSDPVPRSRRGSRRPRRPTRTLSNRPGGWRTSAQASPRSTCPRGRCSSRRC